MLDHGDPWFKPDYQAIQQCLEKIPECVSKVATDHREQHSTVSKVGKAIDRVRRENVSQLFVNEIRV